MADRFMARQPIFDSRLKVFGYELLFRAGPENVFRPGQSPADEVIVNSTMLHDVKQLVGNALAFINVDTAALLREAPRLMAPGKVVVEILETVTLTDEVVDSCRALAKDHYALALDDFLDEPKWQPLIPCVRFLKVDFRLANHEKRRASRNGTCQLEFVCWRKKWRPSTNFRRRGVSATGISRDIFSANHRWYAAATSRRTERPVCGYWSPAARVNWTTTTSKRYSDRSLPSPIGCYAI